MRGDREGDSAIRRRVQRGKGPFHRRRSVLRALGCQLIEAREGPSELDGEVVPVRHVVVMRLRRAKWTREASRSNLRTQERGL